MYIGADVEAKGTIWLGGRHHLVLLNFARIGSIFRLDDYCYRKFLLFFLRLTVKIWNPFDRRIQSRCTINNVVLSQRCYQHDFWYICLPILFYRRVSRNSSRLWFTLLLFGWCFKGTMSVVRLSTKDDNTIRLNWRIKNGRSRLIWVCYFFVLSTKDPVVPPRIFFYRGRRERNNERRSDYLTEKNRQQDKKEEMGSMCVVFWKFPFPFFILNLTKVLSNKKRRRIEEPEAVRMRAVPLRGSLVLATTWKPTRTIKHGFGGRNVMKQVGSKRSYN